MSLDQLAANTSRRPVSLKDTAEETKPMKILKLTFILILIMPFCLATAGGAAASKSFSKLTYIDNLYKQGPAVLSNSVPDLQSARIQIFMYKKSTTLWSQALGGLPSLTPGARPLGGPNLVKDPGLAKLIQKYAQQHGVDHRLVQAMIAQESGFNPLAVSPKGAMGLMQLMPETAASLGVSDPFDIGQNIQGGIRFLKMCLNRFGQNLPLALAAYNAGPGRVDEYNGIPPFQETQNYVKKIVLNYCGQNIDPTQIRLTPAAEIQVAQNKPDEAAKLSAPPPVVKPLNLSFFSTPSPERLEPGTSGNSAGLKKNAEVSIY